MIVSRFQPDVDVERLERRLEHVIKAVDYMVIILTLKIQRINRRFASVPSYGAIDYSAEFSLSKASYQQQQRSL